MKKFIFAIAMASVIIGCKKEEATSEKIEETISSIDSTSSEISKKIEDVQNHTESALDSAQVKIKEIKDVNNDIHDKFESTYKSIDSISKQLTDVKLESKLEEKKDSIVHKVKKATAKSDVPKVIKETKILYKEEAKKDKYELEAAQNKLIKKGSIEVKVNNADDSKLTLKEQLRKYDGILKSENSTTYNDEHIVYLKVKVPIQKFDYFMDELSSNLGEVESKNIESSGYNLIKDTFCDIEITLTETRNPITNNEENKSFGQQSSDAIGSGWDAIKSIFLFLLPFWPIFIIGGAIYYYYKKKKAKNETTSHHQNKDDNDIA